MKYICLKKQNNQLGTRATCWSIIGNENSTILVRIIVYVNENETVINEKEKDFNCRLESILIITGW